MFKNFFVTQILKWTGKKLSGKKMYIAGAGYFCVLVISLIKGMFPEQEYMLTDVSTSIKNFSNAMAVVGGGHKVEKAIKAIKNEALTDAVRKVKKENDKKNK